MPNALGEKEFLTLKMLYDSAPYTHANSGIYELSQTIDSLIMQGKLPNYTGCDRILMNKKIKFNNEDFKIKVCSLSPSDAAFHQAILAFKNFIPEISENEVYTARRIIPPSPNYTSIVLWIEVGIHKILLGSDLENSSDPNAGWSAIIDNSQVIENNRAEIFKIPHHGSNNAHNDGVWSKLLVNNPYSVLSTFRLGSVVLPEEEDIKRICELTNKAYITTLATTKKNKWSSNVVRDMVNRISPEMHKVASGYGHIRLRKKINNNNSTWDVNLFGSAEALVFSV